MTKLRDEGVPLCLFFKFGRHRKDGRCGICRYEKRLQVQENKGQGFDDSCRVAKVWGSEGKSQRCLRLRLEGTQVPVGDAPAAERFGIAWVQLPCLIVVPKRRDPQQDDPGGTLRICPQGFIAICCFNAGWQDPGLRGRRACKRSWRLRRAWGRRDEFRTRDLRSPCS